jgi:RNA polymerase sigma-70 factor (ECF subfamily)
VSETADRKFERWRRTGEARALADVFDEIAPQLLRLAIHLVGDVAAAEDLVQSTFVIAIESAQSWDSSRRLEPWLTGILDHRARKLLRARQRPLDDVAREDVELDTPLARAIASESSAEIAKALDQLEEPYRSVMVLSVMHGMEPAAIAHALVRSPGVVRVQLHRGREMLKKCLPAGVLAGVTLAIGSARGMTAIKTAVMTHAAATPVPTAAAAAGGLIVVKKVLVVACLVGLLASGAVVIARLEATAPPASEAKASTPLFSVPLETSSTQGMADSRGLESTRQPAPAGPGTLVVTGRVVNLPYAGISSKRDPAVQCKVMASTNPRHDWRSHSRVETETDDSGFFRIELQRPPGVPLELIVECPQDPLYHGVDEEREVDAETTTVSDLLFERAAFGRLQGSTQDEQGRPLGNVRVRLMSTVPRLIAPVEAFSGENGRFEMHPTFETSGDIETELEGWSLFTAQRAVALKTGGYSELTLTLAPAGKLIIQALDAGGDPRTRERVRVHVQPADGDPRFDGPMYHGKRFELETDERGIAEFDQLWIGKRLSVRVWGGGGVWWNDVMRNGRLNMYDDPNGEPVIIGPSGVLRLEVPR